MRKLITIIWISIMTFSAMAQENVYTLYQFTPLLYNPAVSALDNDASISLFHEEYSLTAGDYINTNAFSGEYPIIRKESGRRLGGVGLNFLQRNSGQSDLLKTYNAGISLASSIQLAASHSLSVGLAGNYFNKRTSLDNLATGSQWIAEEFRYDPNAGLGEAFEINNVNFLSLGAGAIWQYLKEGRSHSFAGISAYHLNRPGETYFGQNSRIPVTFLVNAGTVLYESRRVIISPQIFYTRVSEVNNYRMILSTKLPFSNTNPYDLIKSGNVDVLLNYGFKGDAAFAVVFNQPGFSFGFGYNFPVGQQNNEAYLQNAYQFGLSLSKTIWKPKPKRVVIESVPQRRDIDFGNNASDPTPAAQSTEVEAIHDKLGELNGVKSLQFELSKDFKFEFGEAEISESSEPFLEDLYELMAENPTYDLRIIGHTDNVGKQQLNYRLSLERAQVVADNLIEKGIEEERIEIIGRGDTEPVSDNDTEEGKAQNRRVEFIINVNR